ncbi:MAG: hypothetical protein ACK470_14540, partial [Pseudanabaena sp.]
KTKICWGGRSPPQQILVLINFHSLGHKTQINEGGAKRHLHLFGFYVLSKTFIAIKNKIGLII